MPDNQRSRAITQGAQRSPNRAMLRAVGFSDKDFDKPIVGVANGFSTITPCNKGLNELAINAEHALKEVRRDATDVRHHYRFRWHLHGH